MIDCEVSPEVPGVTEYTINVLCLHVVKSSHCCLANNLLLTILVIRVEQTVCFVCVCVCLAIHFLT